jgi:CRISPR-associated protein Cmr4
MTTSDSKIALLMAYAVTPVHVGIGQEFGVVDLPIQKDTMNYPVIYSSSFKGALKHYCAKKNSETFLIDEEKKINRVKEGGNCSKLFGSDINADSGIGSVSVTDLKLLLVPARSIDRGPVYLTTHYMIDSAIDLLALLNDESVSGLLKLLKDLKNVNSTNGNKIRVMGAELPVYNQNTSINFFKNNPPSLYQLLSSNGIAVAPNYVDLGETKVDSSVLVDRALVRIARNKLDLARKTTISGALWTEEYIPQGSLFLGIAQGDIATFKQTMTGDFYMPLGGKETIGRGIMRIVVHQ